ncbi:hypothetical protein DXG01_001459, partial [Tephrocybe rancida]
MQEHADDMDASTERVGDLQGAIQRLKVQVASECDSRKAAEKAFEEVNGQVGALEADIQRLKEQLATSEAAVQDAEDA